MAKDQNVVIIRNGKNKVISRIMISREVGEFLVEKKRIEKRLSYKQKRLSNKLRFGLIK